MKPAELANMRRFVDAVALCWSVVTGNDIVGRKHLPARLQKSPFRAVPHQSLLMTSTAGIVVNEKRQVLRRDDGPVPNLYAG